MKPQRIEDFAGEWRMSGAQFNYRDCPECGSHNFKVYVSSETGAWKCFRCDVGGKVDLGADPGRLRRQLMGKYKAPPQSWPLAAMPPRSTSMGSHAQAFVTIKYGLPTETQLRYGLYAGDGDYDGRVIIPFADRSGDVIYYTGRTFAAQEPKYKNMPGKHPLYAPRWVTGDNVGEKRPTVVLVEGPFDAMKVHYATGLHAVAIGGKSLARYLLHDVLALDPGRVLVLLDNDALSASLRLFHQLNAFLDNVERISLPTGQDPGDTSADELRGLLT